MRRTRRLQRDDRLRAAKKRYGPGVRYRVEIPGDDDGAEIRRFVAAWLEHPALRRIVEAEGGAWPSGTLEQRAASLHEFSTRWDFRGGAERLDVSTGAALIAGDELAASASQLGLTSSKPPKESRFEHALVLGGTALASIYRVQHLYDLRASGVDVNAVGVLTALREVSEAERKIVLSRPDIEALMGAAYSEFDVMVAATERFSGQAATVERYQNEDAHLASAEARVGDALVLAAPSSDRDRRANTLDNYNAYSRRIRDGDRVLVVTSCVYLPYQFFIALQALGWDRRLTIEAVGFPPEWMRGVLTGPLNILQELRSGLFGATRTLEALAEAPH